MTKFEGDALVLESEIEYGVYEVRFLDFKELYFGNDGKYSLRHD